MHDIIKKIKKRKYKELYNEVGLDLKKIGSKKKIKKKIVEYEYSKKKWNEYDIYDFFEFINGVIKSIVIIILPIYLSYISSLIWAMFSEGLENKLSVEESFYKTLDYINSASGNVIWIILVVVLFFVIIKKSILRFIENRYVREEKAISILKEIVENIR